MEHPLFSFSLPVGPALNYRAILRLSGQPLPVVTSLAGVLEDRVDPDGSCIEDEYQDESTQAGGDILEFHVAGPGQSLADFNREGESDQYGEDVQERNDNGQSVLCEQRKDRMQDQQHDPADDSDDDEVQLFIRVVISVYVVDIHDLVMQVGNIRDQ